MKDWLGAEEESGGELELRLPDFFQLSGVSWETSWLVKINPRVSAQSAEKSVCHFWKRHGTLAMYPFGIFDYGHF